MGRGDTLSVQAWVQAAPDSFSDAGLSAWVRRHLESERANDASRAEEAQVRLVEVRGTGAAGYYYAVTDKAPASGGFRYLCHGAIALDSLVLRIRAVSNGSKGAVIAPVAAMLRDARVEPR
jgi:hypothetical protein